MAKRKDLIGRRFTKLVVLAFSHVNDKHRACWLCQCDCGNTRIYTTDALIQEHSKSCGCMPHKVILDLTGKTFNNLYVIKFDHMKHQSFWLCRCLLCGTEKVIRGSEVTTGGTKSCGCMPRLGLFKEITWIVDPITGCWNCNSHAHIGNGYPGARRNEKFEPISRIHYKQYKGEIPNGMCVRHTCDNINCVNPAHLLIGTTQDNINDKLERNRQPRGEAIYCSKLLNEEVVDIFEDNVSSRAQLAKRYNINCTTVKRIKSAKTWKHITQPLKDANCQVNSYTEEYSSDYDLLEKGYVRIK